MSSAFYFNFYGLVFDGTYYSITSSVSPSVCPGLVDRIVSSRILQLGTFDQHNERNMPIVIQSWRSKVQIILSHSRKKLQGFVFFTIMVHVYNEFEIKTQHFKQFYLHVKMNIDQLKRSEKKRIFYDLVTLFMISDIWAY